MRLGCVADDFTGATDLAGNLVASGMRVALVLGVPDAPPPKDADAVVVALKTRTIDPAAAVRDSVAAAAWLRAEQLYFKYCSTFDSTDDGNIGPVADGLMAFLGCPLTVAVPAFPDGGRTLYSGHLFVGDRLLSESGMQHHPLTPMTDPDIVRVLARQTRRPVALVAHAAVRAGPEAIRARLEEIGRGIAVVDAVCDEDLRAIAAAVARLPLVTGGSGLGRALAPNWGIAPQLQAAQLPPPAGLRAIVSGSCSQATNRQVRHFLATGRPAVRLDPAAPAPDAVLRRAGERLADGPVLVYSTDDAARVAAARAADVEQALAAIARGLVDAGVRRLIVAGGETAGACVQALGLRVLRVGPAIDPGVPWCHGAAGSAEGSPVHVALKSGNFGSDDFFTRAFDVLG